jgi:hypothetical protein
MRFGTRAKGSLAEFQKVLDQRGMVFADPEGVVARVHMGKPLALARDPGRPRLPIRISSISGKMPTGASRSQENRR